MRHLMSPLDLTVEELYELLDLANDIEANPEKYAELQQQINKGNIIAAYDDDK